MKQFCFLVPGILLLSATLAAAQQPSPEHAATGKQLFMEVGCYECHGYVGQGGSAGPRIAPWKIGPDAFISYVRHPSGQMPPYTAKVISDQDLTEIAAYLKSIPEPKAAKDIPLLREAGGK